MKRKQWSLSDKAYIAAILIFTVIYYVTDVTGYSSNWTRLLGL